MIQNGDIADISWDAKLQSEFDNFFCETCIHAKMREQNTKQMCELPRASYPLQIIFADTIDIPMIVTKDNWKFTSRAEMPYVKCEKILYLVDEYSRMKFVLPLQDKTLLSITSALDIWIRQNVRNMVAQLSRKPSVDRGFEFPMATYWFFPIVEIHVDPVPKP